MRPSRRWRELPPIIPRRGGHGKAVPGRRLSAPSGARRTLRNERAAFPARLDAWMAGNTQPVARCLEILGDIRAAGTYDLMTLPVALREVRNLIQSTAPVTGDGARPAA